MFYIEFTSAYYCRDSMARITSCEPCRVYIYDVLLDPVEPSNPIFPYVRIRESTVSRITPIVYRIQSIKCMLMTDMPPPEQLEELDYEMDVLYTILTDNDIISRKSGRKRFSYTHRWIREKLMLLDMYLDTIHSNHSNHSNHSSGVFLEIEQNATSR